MSGSATPHSPDWRALSTGTPSATSAYTWRRERAPSRPSSVALAVGPGDYVILPRGTTHRWVPAGDRAAANVHHRGELAHRPASALPLPLRPVPRAFPLLRAGPARPGCADASGRQRRRGLRQAPRRAGQPRSAGPCTCSASTRSTWSARTGACTRTPSHIADFEPITGQVRQTTAGASGVRGRQLRDLQLRAAEDRLSPAGGAGSVLPLERRLRRGPCSTCGGEYQARSGSGIGSGSVSLHPGGHIHGPQPGAAVERSLGSQAVDELAVMVDTFRPLSLGEGGVEVDDHRYAWTWSDRGPA